MGIDISQWRAVIGRNKPAAPKDMTKSKKHEHMRTKEAAQETIRNESLHFWKTAIILVSLLLGVWFFFAHSLPGDGMGSEKMSSSVTAVKVHILLHMHIVIYIVHVKEKSNLACSYLVFLRPCAFRVPSCLFLLLRDFSCLWEG